MRIGWALALAAMVFAMPAHADLVTDWADYATKLEADADDTPEAGLADSQMAVAMFEAANAIDPHYRSLCGMPPVAPGASAEAAVIAAAREVLVRRYPAKQDRIVENAAFAIAALPASATAKTAGEAVGAEAARLALGHGGVDAAIPQRPYRPRTNPGVWVGAALPAFQPFWQAMKPWVLARVDAVRPPPPPALTSARYARDYDEVKRLGGKTSTERTAQQTLMARYRITPASCRCSARSRTGQGERSSRTHGCSPASGSRNTIRAWR